MQNIRQNLGYIFAQCNGFRFVIAHPDAETIYRYAVIMHTVALKTVHRQYFIVIFLQFFLVLLDDDVGALVEVDDGDGGQLGGRATWLKKQNKTFI